MTTITFVSGARGLDPLVPRPLDRPTTVDLDDPERRTTMGAACVRWASGYSWETMHRSAVSLVARAVTERS